MMFEPYYVTLQEAVNELAVLPTEDAVADHLVSLGVTAVPQEASRCALAVFFEMRTGRHTTVGPLRADDYHLLLETKSFLVVREPDWYAIQHDNLKVMLPDVLTQMARKFDDCQYPKLLNERTAMLISAIINEDA